MDSELISREERADGTAVRFYVNEEGREIMEEIPPCGKEVVRGCGCASTD